MTATNTFFLWFYYGLSGLGGWFIFLLVALAAVIWLFYDSAKRRLPAMGWRLGIALAAILILPAILYRFTVNDIADIATSPLGPFSEPIFYLGVLGGVLPVVLAIGYYVSYQGMVGCPQGHVYEAALGNCPHPDHLPPSPPLPPVGEPLRPPAWDSAEETALPMAPAVRKQLAQAWLVTRDGRKNYQLFARETRVGRSLKNDIVFEGDRSVSRESARILEQNGHFRLYSLTAVRFPRVNGHTVREPVLLEHDDEIEFGENTLLRFIKSR
jgi:hypothetical protein